MAFNVMLMNGKDSSLELETGVPALPSYRTADRPSTSVPISVYYCFHHTHSILHLHVAHGGVWRCLGPVRELLVAPSLGIEQMGERAQLEVVSVYKTNT